MNGVFAVAKPGGPTSQEVVAHLKKIFTSSPFYEPPKQSGPKGQKGKRGRGRKDWIKIGHGGTLDPLADGVLVLGVGTGTKRLQGYLSGCSKVYKAIALFGCSTTTYDQEGAVLAWGPTEKLDDNLVQKALEAFKGEISQLPPVFSALKMDGKPLYEYAREGKLLPRPIEPRICNIDFLKAGKLNWDHKYMFPENIASAGDREFASKVSGEDYLPETTRPTAGPILELEFSVSSGTYIRSLVHDLGKALGTQAHLVSLTRVSQGPWSLGKNTLSFELFDKPYEEWWKSLKPVLDDGPDRALEN